MAHIKSNHYSTDRTDRKNVIEYTIGRGKIVDEFVVDRGHKNGAEIHKISNTGIISIYNQKTKKLITELIARPAQIKRYYAEGQAPKYLVDIAYNNTVKYRYNACY